MPLAPGAGPSAASPVSKFPLETSIFQEFSNQPNDRCLKPVVGSSPGLLACTQHPPGLSNLIQLVSIYFLQCAVAKQTQTLAQFTNSSAPGGMLDGLVDFFKEYMLLVVVVGSLAFVLLFIICAAVIVRQKHKASAYYPSSFPKKKYVDQRDKAGGARAFSEVPEKAPDPSAEEPLDCSRQLQADILAAAQNLKSPPKAPLANGTREEQKPPAEEEEEEEGSKKLGYEQSAEPPPQNAGAEEAVGATGARGEGAPNAAQDGSPAPPSV
uniref:Transmembrane protein 119 n=1 Tax=Buteo japonicus TaxID=224669 RepID=A0A8C0BBH6_9AVES